MLFRRVEPCKELKDLVDCFWIIQNDDPKTEIQKIIPDGFPEIIFHFGDPYAINLDGQWEIQKPTLLAGQITKHFFLRNTGRSDILGIKFKPASLTHLFDLSMHTLTDKVVNLNALQPPLFQPLEFIARLAENHTNRIINIQHHLEKGIRNEFLTAPIEKALTLIFASNGLSTIAEICHSVGISERQLERLFMRYVGLPPKFYARIIRFSYIFTMVQKKEMKGSELSVASGFYDQSHFIKNFKAFTGDDPSRYMFNQPNLANFFMKKK